MLPGLRFLCAAIALSVSMLVFGLGAAALLRTTHERFVNAQSIRVPPSGLFARQNDAPAPTLSMLRFEPPAAPKLLEQPVNLTTSAREAGPAPDIAPPAEPAAIAASSERAGGASEAIAAPATALPAGGPSDPSESRQPDPANLEQKKSEPADPEPSMQTAAVAPAAGPDESTTASVPAAVAARAGEPAAALAPSPAGNEPPSNPLEAAAQVKNASLSDPTASPEAKPASKPIVRNHAQARRVKKRRRHVVERARTVRPATGLPVSPFGSAPGR